MNDTTAQPVSRDTTDTKPNAEGQRMSDREALRDRIARALFLHQQPDAAGAWDAPGDGGRAAWRAKADAVLPIVEQLQADNEALRLVVAKVTALADKWIALCPEGDWPESGSTTDAVISDAGRALREVLAEVTPQPAPVPTPESSQP